jgi:predicted GNAT family N-acyltransferase
MVEDSQTDITVIEYGSAHYAQAARLRYTLFYQMHGIRFASIFAPSEPQDYHVAVIRRQDDRVLAYGRLTQNHPIEYQIYQMVVEPEYQRHGFGSQILETLCQLAMENGARQIILNARITMSGFYEKRGFVPVGSVFLSSVTGVPHIKMQKIVLNKSN